MIRLLVPAGIAAAVTLTSSVFAQAPRDITTVVPEAATNIEGNYNLAALFQNNRRVVSLYRASKLASESTVRIRGLRFRPNGGAALAAGSADVTFDLSTSSKLPGTMSTAYNDNHGDDRERVFDGTVSWSATVPSGSPEPYAIEVTFGSPYEWNPRSGSLVIDARCTSGPAAGPHIDSDTVGVGSVVGSLGSAAGLSLSGAPVVELILATNSAPSGLVNNEGPSGAGSHWGYAANSWRMLDIYDAASLNLDGRTRINTLSWRPNGGATYSGGTYDCEIFLSTTTVDVANPSTVFNNNHGSNRTLVYEGDLTFAPVTVTETPQAFDLTCFLQTPFEYNSALGNLVVEVLVHNSSHATSELMDTLPIASNPVTRVFSVNNGTPASGSIGSNVSVLGINTEPMPTIPEAHDAQFFNGRNRDPFHRDSSRAMFLYPPSELATTKAIWIDHIAFRPAASATEFGPVTWECTVDMSEALVAAGPLDSTFENNHGARRRRVFDGKVSVPFVAGGAPAEEFPITIKLDSAFYYDPSSGPLIVDMRVTDRNGSTDFVDAATTSNIWRVVHNSDADALVSTSNSHSGLVIRLGGVGANALAESYGSGCAGANGTPECFVRSLPNLPNDDFAVDLRNGPNYWFNLLLLGATEANLPLSIAGAPGCTLLTNYELGTFLAITDPAGDASYPVPLPNDPAFYDQELFVQWACLEQTVNNLGVTFSNGVRLLLKR